ncbi:MAG: methyl-coenzyme M reductase family protein [Methanomassiliicoccales archaeon]|jgi:putative methanogenesis marker protein 7
MMEDYRTLIYDGGSYRFGELAELLEDTGSYILRREDTIVSTVAVMAVPSGDVRAIRRKAKEIGGVLTRAPLAGTEIAVVAPSPSGRHLPHPACDIAEFLRRNGAQTILISLARGTGQEPMLDHGEVALINESDLAVFALGDSKVCLREKKGPMFENLRVPVVVAAGPKMRRPSYCTEYVGGLGRRAARMKGPEDLARLKELVDAAERCVKDRKKELKWLPDVSIPALGQAIERELPEVKDATSPSPIMNRIDGLRVKLDYERYHERIAEVRYAGSRLGDLADISRSVLKDQVLIRLRPRGVV